MFPLINARRWLVVATLLLVASNTGCASNESAATDGTSDDDVTSSSDKLDVTSVLNARAKKTFANATSLKGSTPQVEFAYFASDGTYAVALGVVRRVDSAGKASPLTAADIAGSTLASRVGKDLDARMAAYFSVALVKKGPAWSVVTKGTEEGYFVPGSHAQIESWRSVFGVPPALVQKVPH